MKTRFTCVTWLLSITLAYAAPSNAPVKKNEASLPTLPAATPSKVDSPAVPSPLDTIAKRLLLAGGLFDVPSNETTDQAKSSHLNLSGISNPVTSLATPFAKETIAALERVVARRAQAEAVDWLLSSMPKKDRKLLDSIVPRTWNAVQNPGYGGMKRNMASVRAAFQRDLDSIALDSAVMNVILKQAGITLDTSEWIPIYRTLDAARKHGFSPSSLLSLLRINPNSAGGEVLVATFLSWQRNAGSLQSILSSDEKLKSVLAGAHLLYGDSGLSDQKFVEFLLHLRDNATLLECGRDSLIRVLPTFLDLVAEGADAFGIPYERIRMERVRRAMLFARALLDKKYPNSAIELLSLYRGKAKLSPRLATLAGFVDALAVGDTLALADALERTMAPIGGWKEKRNGLTHLTITAYAGVGIQVLSKEPHRFQYGLKVPLGPEIACPYLGLMFSVLDLGHVMSLEESSVEWRPSDVLAPGVFLRGQPFRSPAILFGGVEWRNEDPTWLGGAAIDVTLWRL